MTNLKAKLEYIGKVKNFYPKEYVIKNEETIIGRDSNCDFILPLGKFKIISREHAQITRKENDFYIEDLESRAGTWVNGKKLENKEKIKLEDKSKIVFAKKVKDVYSFIFRLK